MKTLMVLTTINYDVDDCVIMIIITVTLMAPGEPGKSTDIVVKRCSGFSYLYYLFMPMPKSNVVRKCRCKKPSLRNHSTDYGEPIYETSNTTTLCRAQGIALGATV